MITPVWLIPILAFLLMLDKLEKFKNKKPRNFLYLGKAVVDLYFIIVYLWISFDPLTVAIERAEAVRAGILLLFGLNLLYIMIERVEEYLKKKKLEKLLKIGDRNDINPNY